MNEITVKCVDVAYCMNCGENLNSYDEVVYWEGNEVVDPLGYGVLKAGLYHTECYEACKEN